MGLWRTMAALATVPILVLAAPSTGLAADPSPPDSAHPMSVLRLPSGAVVRATLQAVEEPVIGRYRATTMRTIELEPLKTAPQREILTVPIDRAVRFEVSRKRSVHTWQGLLIGLLVGGAATYADITHAGPLAGFVLVPVGMGWGALVGGGIVSYHWETVWESESPSEP